MNGDRITNDYDILILWKLFSCTLNSSNFNKYINAKSLGVRGTYQQVRDYFSVISGKGINPTVLDAFHNRWDSGSIHPTGSNLCPYITSIGLYNGLDLVAIAKLGTPIKNEGYFPLNFIVRFDI
jgi:hypothetical protein